MNAFEYALSTEKCKGIKCTEEERNTLTQKIIEAFHKKYYAVCLNIRWDIGRK